MAFLIGNIAFNAEINVGLAHQLVRTAEDLTYRQLCILKIAAMTDRKALRQGGYREQRSFDKPLYGVLYECYDLYNRGLINFGGSAALGLTDVDPASMVVEGMGADLFNEMGLATIPQVNLIQSSCSFLDSPFSAPSYFMLDLLDRYCLATARGQSAKQA